MYSNRGGRVLFLWDILSGRKPPPGWLGRAERPVQTALGFANFALCTHFLNTGHNEEPDNVAMPVHRFAPDAVAKDLARTNATAKQLFFAEGHNRRKAQATKCPPSKQAIRSSPVNVLYRTTHCTPYR